MSGALPAVLAALPLAFAAMIVARRWTGAAPERATLLAAALVIAGGGAVAGSWSGTLAALVLMTLLAALAEIDRRVQLLPDPLTALLFGTGLIAALTMPAPGLAPALWGAALGAGGFWMVREAYFRLRGVEGLGLGDVKLMAGLGVWFGAGALPLLVTTAALGGLVLALVAARRSGQALSGQSEMPFGTCLCAAAAVIRILDLA